MVPQAAGHVFISYVHEDQAYTRELADSLRERGFEVWMDDRIDFGDRWWQTIVQAIDASAAFVVVMTPDAERSEWVEREVMVALDEGKPLFPLLLRGRRFPLLVTTQYADVTGGRLPPDDFYERLEREVRSRSKEEIVAPLAPERAIVRKGRAWSWQRLRLPLAVVGLLAIVLLVGVGAFWLSGSDWRLMRASTATEPVVAPPITETPTVTATPLPGTDTPTPSPPALPTIHATIPQYLAMPPLAASLADT